MMSTRTTKAFFFRTTQIRYLRRKRLLAIILSEKIRRYVLERHQASFVHGDIRDTSIRVKKSGFHDESFTVVDYDSCGRITRSV